MKPTRSHRSPLPPDRRLAAPAHAAASRSAGAASIGRRWSRSRRKPLARSRGAVRGSRGVPRASLQGIRHVPAVRAAIPLRLHGRPGGRRARRAGKHAGLPAGRRREGPHHPLAGRQAERCSTFSTSVCISSSTRTSPSSRSRCMRTIFCSSRAGHAVPLRPRIPGVLGKDGQGGNCPVFRRSELGRNGEVLAA